MAVLHQFKKGCMLLLLMLVPAVFASTCDLSNIGHVIKRNNTLLNAMNNTIINMTEAANTALASVSTFPLVAYLTSQGVSQSNLLRFVALGGLNLDWTNLAKNYTVKDTSIGELGAHILSVFVIPAHAALQTFAAKYSFSYGLFRSTTNDFRFYALLDTGTTNLDMSNLDSSCVAGKRYEVSTITTDVAWASVYSNTSSSSFADLAYTFETFFEQLFRGSAVASDFIRCNVAGFSSYSFVGQWVACKLEIYLATDSNKTADVKKILSVAAITPFPVQLNSGKVVKIYTPFMSLNSSNPPSTTTSTTTTTTITPTTVTTTTTTTTVTTSSTPPSTPTADTTLTSSTLVPMTTGPTSTTSMVPTATPTTSVSASTFLASSVPTTTTNHASTTASALATVTNPTTLSLSTASTSLLLTALSTSSNSLATGMAGTPQTASSASGTSINTSLPTLPTGGGSSVATAESANNTSVDSLTTTPNSSALNTGSSAASNVSATSMQITTTPGMQSSGLQNVQSSTVSAPLSNLSTSNALLNSTVFPVTNRTANSSGSFTAPNSSTKPSYRSTTFDPDPLFLAEVPVFTKLYNDDYLLRMKMGTMKPMLERASLYSVTIPAAIGLAALVVVCLVLLQIDCLQPSGKT